MHHQDVIVFIDTSEILLFQLTDHETHAFTPFILELSECMTISASSHINERIVSTSALSQASAHLSKIKEVFLVLAEYTLTHQSKITKSAERSQHDRTNYIQREWTDYLQLIVFFQRLKPLFNICQL